MAMMSDSSKESEINSHKHLFMLLAGTPGPEVGRRTVCVAVANILKQPLKIPRACVRFQFCPESAEISRPDSISSLMGLRRVPWCRSGWLLF